MTFGTIDAQAQLVPQMARCAPDFGDEGHSVQDQIGAGVYNTETQRKNLRVKFVYAKGAADPTEIASIQATNRVEVCSVGAMGALSCPGWTGDTDWIIYDRNLVIG